MAGRGLLLAGVLLAGCLSSPQRGGDGDGDDAGTVTGDGAGEGCQPIAFTEDFDGDGWIEERWQGSGEDAAGMIAAQEGRAVIVLTAEANDYGWFETGAQFDFTGRCVHVAVPVMVAHGTGVDTEVYLTAVLGDHEVALGQSGGDLCCEHWLADELVAERCEASYSPEQHARWRLRFEGGEAICDTATAEGAWAEYRRVGYDGPLTGTIELSAGAWDPVADAGQVEFDDLNL